MKKVLYYVYSILVVCSLVVGLVYLCITTEIIGDLVKSGAFRKATVQKGMIFYPTLSFILSFIFCLILFHIKKLKWWSSYLVSPTIVVLVLFCGVKWWFTIDHDGMSRAFFLMIYGGWYFIIGITQVALLYIYYRISNLVRRL